MTVTHVAPGGWIVSIPPEPLMIAQRLKAARASHLALLHRSEPGRSGPYSYVAAFSDGHSQDLDPTHVDDGHSVEASALLHSVPRWIGVIPYEARRELERPTWCEEETRDEPLICRPCWLRYPALFRIDHRSGVVMLIGREHADRQRLFDAYLAGDLASGVVPQIDVDADEPEERHLSRVKEAIELIRAGEIYQVSLARRLSVRQRRGEALDLYARLAASAPSAFGAYLEFPEDTAVLSTSPELLLRAVPNQTDEGAWPGFERLYTEPIKGTRPRGVDAASDRQLRAELEADPKERAELSMIIDVERNDLGRVARTGTVSVIKAPHVVSHRTVHHRKALIAATVRADVDRAQVFATMVPSGSVTGAPKVRAMELIRELESHRRGLYTGAIGYVNHGGGVALSMAIRTLVLRSGQGHYWTGGGIVVDSDPRTELRETAWKAEQLRRAASRRSVGS